MSNERLGISDSLEAERTLIAARLSPAARHQAFPHVYARPIPRPSGEQELREQNRAFEADNKRLSVENADLTRRVLDLEKRLAEAAMQPAHLERSCYSVCKAF